MLSAAELTSLRSQLLTSLPDTATLRRPATTSDGQGGVTVAWTETASVPCRLTAREAMGNRGPEGDQSEVSTVWSILVAFDRDIAAGDQVVSGGKTWTVQSVADIPSERTHRRAELRRVE